MFIIDSQLPDNLPKKLRIMLKVLEKSFGEIPLHFKLLAALDSAEAESTLEYLIRLMQHPTINPDLFPFIRLHVANREGYNYCINFNSALLKTRGFGDDILECIKANIVAVPFTDREKALAEKSIKALYSPKDFGRKDLKEMYILKWSDSEIFDVINHAAFLLKNGKVISTYLE